MTRRARWITVAFAAMAAVLLGTTPAAAGPARDNTATGWLITPTGYFDGQGNITIGLFTCPAVVWGQVGTAPWDLGIGRVQGVEFDTCTGPIGMAAIANAYWLPWNINGISFDGAADTVHGTITGMAIAISGPGCIATFTGAVTMTYENQTAEMGWGGNNLTASGVSGCLGLIKNGDRTPVSAQFAIDPPLIIRPL